MADRAVALQGALESITLLKNEGQLLPLDAAKIKTIAVIGPDAWPAVPGGGGSSEAQAFEPVSILTGIANLLGPDVHVLYSRGLPDMNDVFWQHPLGGRRQGGHLSQQGLHRHARNRHAADHRQLASRMVGSPETRRRAASATPPAYKADKAGKYLILAAAGLRAATIQGAGRRQADSLARRTPKARSRNRPRSIWPPARPSTWSPTICPRSVGTRFGLGIAYEPDLISDEAASSPPAADAVVVAVGFNPATESEGYDRTFALPWGQDALIEAVAAANPHTIVTLTGGGGMDTRRWLDKVPALLHT